MRKGKKHLGNKGGRKKKMEGRRAGKGEGNWLWETKMKRVAGFDVSIFYLNPALLDIPSRWQNLY